MTDVDYINANFAPVASYEGERKVQFNTEVVMIGSTEMRRVLWTNGRYRWTLVHQSQDHAAMDVITGLFLMARGRAARFSFVDPFDGVTRTVRFSNDQLSTHISGWNAFETNFELIEEP